MLLIVGLGDFLFLCHIGFNLWNNTTLNMVLYFTKFNARILDISLKMSVEIATLSQMLILKFLMRNNNKYKEIR